VSSFSQPHHLYLFDMKSGKKKLAYGESPEDALRILRFRLTEAEMAEIVHDRCTRVSQRRLQDYVDQLG
jgi:hypothetical protein